jgi:hypothetical protein
VLTLLHLLPVLLSNPSNLVSNQLLVSAQLLKIKQEIGFLSTKPDFLVKASRSPEGPFLPPTLSLAMKS